MTNRSPDAIWDEGLIEGERRLERGWPALAATAFAGGADVMSGIFAVVVATAGLSTTMPEAAAHLIACCRPAYVSKAHIARDRRE